MSKRRRFSDDFKAKIAIDSIGVNSWLEMIIRKRENNLIIFIHEV